MRIVFVISRELFGLTTRIRRNGGNWEVGGGLGILIGAEVVPPAPLFAGEEAVETGCGEGGLDIEVR